MKVASSSDLGYMDKELNDGRFWANECLQLGLACILLADWQPDAAVEVS